MRLNDDWITVKNINVKECDQIVDGSDCKTKSARRWGDNLVEISWQLKKNFQTTKTKKGLNARLTLVEKSISLEVESVFQS